MIFHAPEADSVKVVLFGEVDVVIHDAAEAVEAVEFLDDKNVAVAKMLERFRSSRAIGVRRDTRSSSA